MSCLIQGIGTATPQGAISQEDAARLSERYCCPTPEQARLLPVLYRRTRVKMRHSVLLSEHGADNQEGPEFYPFAASESDQGPTTGQRMEAYQRHAADLGVQASCNAIKQSNVAPSEITHLITVSCTGFCSPGFDVELVSRLQLCPHVARTHLGFLGCHGAMNAIRVAQGFAEMNVKHRVLVCAVELCSLHHQYGWNPDRVVSNALFADGAGALIIGGDTPSSPLGLLQQVASTSTIVPDTQGEMSWRIGDHGYAMTLEATVPEIIRKRLSSTLAPWLKTHDLTVDDIGSWLVHPGGPRILDATSVALGLSEDALSVSSTILENYGNMSSPTVLFVLQEAIKRNRPGPYVMLGFGPGLTIEAALLRD